MVRKFTYDHLLAWLIPQCKVNLNIKCRNVILPEWLVFLTPLMLGWFVFGRRSRRFIRGLVENVGRYYEWRIFLHISIPPTASPLIFMTQMLKTITLFIEGSLTTVFKWPISFFGGKFLKNLLCRVDEEYNKLIRFYQSIWRCKSATVKSFWSWCFER